jgi:hypothetical protein
MINRNPLLQTIHQLQENGATGSLPLSHAGQSITIYLREGLISAVSTALRVLDPAMEQLMERMSTKSN